jgi:hypothetical protein
MRATAIPREAGDLQPLLELSSSVLKSISACYRADIGDYVWRAGMMHACLIRVSSQRRSS